MPHIGTRVQTAEGPGKVVGLNLLERLLQVSMTDQDLVLEYTLEEILDQQKNIAQLIK